MAKDSGFIDLGKAYDPKAEVMAIEKGPKTSYPTLFVNHDMKDGSGLDDLPDGEFTFTAKGKVVSYKEDMKAGTCSCEIEVMAIKPDTTKAKPAKDAGDGLNEALGKIAKSKAKADPNEANEDPEEEASETPDEEDAEMAEGS